MMKLQPSIEQTKSVMGSDAIHNISKAIFKDEMFLGYMYLRNNKASRDNMAECMSRYLTLDVIINTMELDGIAIDIIKPKGFLGNAICRCRTNNKTFKELEEYRFGRELKSADHFDAVWEAFKCYIAIRMESTGKRTCSF